MPVEQLRSGTWRFLLPSAATAHAAVAAGRALDDAARIAAEDLTLEARAAIESHPGVRHAYVNGYLEYSATPSDPFYAYQRWHYEAAKLPSPGTTAVATAACASPSSTARPTRTSTRT